MRMPIDSINSLEDISSSPELVLGLSFLTTLYYIIYIYNKYITNILRIYNEYITNIYRINNEYITNI